MAGGFGMTGNPVHLLNALAEPTTGDLTIISNNVGEPGLGGGRLLRNGQTREGDRLLLYLQPGSGEGRQAGAIEIQLIPKAPWPRRSAPAARASAASYTPTGVGTVLAEGAETKVIDGEELRLRAGAARPTWPWCAPGRPTRPATWSTA